MHTPTRTCTMVTHMHVLREKIWRVTGQVHTRVYMLILSHSPALLPFSTFAPSCRGRRLSQPRDLAFRAFIMTLGSPRSVPHTLQPLPLSLPLWAHTAHALCVCVSALRASFFLAFFLSFYSAFFVFFPRVLSTLPCSCFSTAARRGELRKSDWPKTIQKEWRKRERERERRRKIYLVASTTLEESRARARATKTTTPKISRALKTEPVQ